MCKKISYERRNLAWIFIIFVRAWQSSYWSLFPLVTHQFPYMVTVYDISTQHNMRLVVGHGGEQCSIAENTMYDPARVVNNVVYFWEIALFKVV